MFEKDLPTKTNDGQPKQKFYQDDSTKSFEERRNAYQAHMNAVNQKNTDRSRMLEDLVDNLTQFIDKTDYSNTMHDQFDDILYFYVEFDEDDELQLCLDKNGSPKVLKGLVHGTTNVFHPKKSLISGDYYFEVEENTRRLNHFLSMQCYYLLRGDYGRKLVYILHNNLVVKFPNLSNSSNNTKNDLLFEHYIYLNTLTCYILRFRPDVLCHITDELPGLKKHEIRTYMKLQAKNRRNGLYGRL